MTMKPMADPYETGRERPHNEVAGKCPACGWAGLFLGSGGYVTCPQSDCPNPTLAADLLDGHYLATKRAVEFLELLADGGDLRVNGIPWREAFRRFNEIISDGVILPDGV